MINNTNEEEVPKAGEESPEQKGKKAIEADKKINKGDKSFQQKEDEEKKDAEQWRNEG